MRSLAVCQQPQGHLGRTVVVAGGSTRRAAECGDGVLDQPLGVAQAVELVLRRKVGGQLGGQPFELGPHNVGLADLAQPRQLDARATSRCYGGFAMARPGLEPGTPRFSVVCSTN